MTYFDIIQFDLTPLQVSIEEISERCKKFQSVIFSPIPNMKGLQMVLQGSVRIQVNSGPLGQLLFLRNFFFNFLIVN